MPRTPKISYSVFIILSHIQPIKTYVEIARYLLVGKNEVLENSWKIKKYHVLRIFLVIFDKPAGYYMIMGMFKFLH